MGHCFGGMYGALFFSPLSSKNVHLSKHSRGRLVFMRALVFGGIVSEVCMRYCFFSSKFEKCSSL